MSAAGRLTRKVVDQHTTVSDYQLIFQLLLEFMEYARKLISELSQPSLISKMPLTFTDQQGKA